MELIQTERIPKPKGHYSPAVKHNGVVYVSGQLPVNPINREIPSGIEEQTKQVLENLDLILKESGSNREKVLQVRIYVSDISLWGIVNEVYTSFFKNHKPARCVVPTRDLHYGSLIEVEAIAIID